MIRPRRNFLLIVRVQLKRGRNLTIPVSLWALEESLEAFSCLAWLLEKIFSVNRGSASQPRNKWTAYLLQLPVSHTIESVGQLIRDLRKLGRFRLVEVEQSDIKVHVDLW